MKRAVGLAAILPHCSGDPSAPKLKLCDPGGQFDLSLFDKNGVVERPDGKDYVGKWAFLCKHKEFGINGKSKQVVARMQCDSKGEWTIEQECPKECTFGNAKVKSLGDSKVQIKCRKGFFIPGTNLLKFMKFTLEGTNLIDERGLLKIGTTLSCGMECLKPTPPTKIAFGSCFKQYDEGAKQTKIFDRITEEKPEMFFWTGDAAYQVKTGFKHYKKALNQTKTNPAYKKLIENIPVDGMWDDHDLGPNDADRNVARIDDRRKLFLRFLGVPKSDPRWKKDMKALYFTKTFGPTGQKVKFFFLDTRTERQTYYQNDRSECFDETMCVGYENVIREENYPNDTPKNDNATLSLLGQKQHEWFEKKLEKSNADVNIIVSGIQIFSKDIAMENWMHWHADRRRLFRTLKKVNPKGLIFLSGDVHRAEKFKLGDTWMEMTSSGINRGNLSEHTGIWAWKAEEYCGVQGQNYCYNNYGMLEFDWDKRKVTVSARGEDGKAHLTWSRNMDDRVADKLDLYQPKVVPP